MSAALQMQDGFFMRIFPVDGEDRSSSWRRAESWCTAHGISIGRMQALAPRGLLFGDYDIQKWRNLSAADRHALHGIAQRASDGSVHLTLRKAPVDFKDDGPVYELNKGQQQTSACAYVHFVVAGLKAEEADDLKEMSA